MEQPRYYAEIDLSQRSSQALMVEQVGFDKRVLDVGCAGGYLGAAFVQRGCRVVGIEIDPHEAAEAKKVLDDVVVGDIEEMDLVAAFGEGAFDVVVFGDVLEHLKDPARPLRQARSLLRQGGYVVASIPNVAHGSVRLALLRGDFTYRDTGLLDDTHLRWFTRASLESLFLDNGFVITDLERTICQLFDTEIPLERASFPAELVTEVEQSEEGLTYQFVVRAVPDDATASIRRLAVREAAQREEIFALRAELQDYRRLVWPEAPPACRVGILGAFDPGRIDSALVAPVLVAELRRRIAGLEVRLLTTGESGATILDTLDPVEPLAPLTDGRVRQLAEGLDAFIVIDHDAAGLVQRAEISERLLLHRAARAPGADDIAPLELLLPRALRPRDLHAHLEMLRSEGRFPSEARVVALVGLCELGTAAGEIVAALASLEEERGDIALVVIESGPDEAEVVDAFEGAREGRVFSLRCEQTLDVLAALLGSSAVVAAGADPLVAAAVGYGRPTMVAGWTGPHAKALAERCGGIPVAPAPADLASVLARALDGSADRPDLETIAVRLDDRLDALATTVSQEAQRRAAPLPPRSASELGAYFRRLQEAYAVLARRADEDRARLGSRVRVLGVAVRDAEQRAEAAATQLERDGAENALNQVVLRQANVELAQLQLDLLARHTTREPSKVPPIRSRGEARVVARSAARRLAGRARAVVKRFRARRS